MTPIPTTPTPSTPSQADPGQGPTPAEAPREVPPRVTEHTLQTPDGPIRYRASAGRMLVGDEELDGGAYRGQRPRAQVFVTSYVRTDLPEGTEPGGRPVVFAFNGGPGSSSAWLHLGLFGPRLTDSGDVDQRTPPPYRLRDNPQTLLRDADLVFIDPMSTGFTRAIEDATPADHHGFTGDRDLVGETIRRWLSRNNRWLSPKFLAGESYGTTRAAALAGWLARRHGIAVNGVILISIVLEFASIRFTPGNDEPYVHYLPTYAALAHYHGTHPDRSLAEVVAEAATLAAGDYRRALAMGHRLEEDTRRAVAERVAGLLGLDPAYVLRSDLRIEHSRFFAELLRDRGLVVGRLDGRVSAPPRELVHGEQQVDPSMEFIQFPYTAAANHYLRAELGHDSTDSYEVLTDRVQPWSYKEFENRAVTTADDLADAMRGNPDLHVYAAFGYYDGATPFAAAEHTLAHLAVPREAYARVMRRYYEAGHMMYVHEPSRLAQSADIAEFVAWATGGAEPPAEASPLGEEPA